MAEFTTPEFLLNKSADDFHDAMIAALPADLDVSQGGHAWNLTRVTALVAAEICEFILPEVVMNVNPDWAYGTMLDSHAKTRNLYRREATPATGELTLTGDPGVYIPAGALFSTESVNDEPSVDYQTTEAATIGSTGSVTVPIECTQAGTVGNTPAGTIGIVSSKITGLSGVINETDVTGGTELEDDDSLRARIEEYDRSLENSFIGNPSDYKRWATSVDGVGGVTVISAQDNTGEVTLIITDANGQPATEQLLDEVYNYIMEPDDPLARKAPIGAYLTVVAPDTMPLSIQAVIELETGASLEAVKAAYLAQVGTYLAEAIEDGEVKYTRLAAILARTEGVNDYKELLIGIKTDGTYGTANLPITSYQLPTVAEEDLNLTSGTV